MIRYLFCAAVLAVGASQPATANGSDLPPKPAWQTDAQNCSWHWREGGGVGLWAETCNLSTGEWRVDWSSDQGAFVVRHNGAAMGVVVQAWDMPKSTGISALTQQMVQRGHLASATDCEWRAIPLRPSPRTTAFHVLTAKDPAALKPTALGEVPDPICGPYGASTHGVRYFVTDLRWRDRAIFVDEGQERPMFDPASIVLNQ